MFWYVRVCTSLSWYIPPYPILIIFILYYFTSQYKAIPLHPVDLHKTVKGSLKALTALYCLVQVYRMQGNGLVQPCTYLYSSRV